MKLTTDSVKECNCCGSSRLKNCLQFEEFVDFYSAVRRLLFNVSACGSCGLVFLNPQPNNNLLSYHYSHQKKEPIAGRRCIYRFNQAKYIDKHVNIKGKAFDVGCFDGTFLAFLKKSGWDVSGCDLDKKGLKIANDKHGISALEGDFEDVDVRNHSRDLISFIHVVEHLQDPNRVFYWSHNKLSDNGYLYIAVPDISRLFCNAVYEFFSYPHLYYFSPVTLGNYCRKHGFEIVDLRRSKKFPFFELIAKKGTKSRPIAMESDFNNAIELLHAYEHSRRNAVESFQNYFYIHKDLWERRHARLVIWGAGLHTHMVFSLLDMGGLDIVRIVDSNQSLQEQELFGHRIYSPEKLASLKPDVVLVSSYWFASDIAKAIRSQLGDGVEIFFFYGKPTSGHPIAGDY